MSDPAPQNDAHQPSPVLQRAEASSALGQSGLRRGYMDAHEKKSKPPGLSDEPARAYEVGQKVLAAVLEEWEVAPHWMPNTPPHKKIIDAAVAMGLTPAVFEGGAEAVRAMLLNAPVITADDLPPEDEGAASAPPDDDGDAADVAGDEADAPDADDPERAPAPRRVSVRDWPPEELPGSFPLTPLGKDRGTYYYIDRTGQLAEVVRGRHSPEMIKELVADFQYLARTYPVRNANGEWQPKKYQHDVLRDHLVQACNAKGIWSPADKERGAGASLDEDGHLVMHFGDHLLVDGERRAPGVLGRLIYPTAQALPPPCSRDEAAEASNPGAELLEILSTWNWVRGEIDARLMLGQICCGVMGGALPWRPVGWVTGGAQTGKSNLNKMLEALYGSAAYFSDDTTAASITAGLEKRTVPVFLDEVEPSEDGRKEKQLVETARVMASGGKKRRSSAEHKAVQFTMRSTVMFSSIDMPPLEPQDRTRMVVYKTQALRPGAIAPDISQARMRPIYQRLVRRLIDGWPRFDAVLEQYAKALLAAGHTNRTGRDLFGTLLAMSEVVLNDQDILKADELAKWAKALAADALDETSEQDSSELRCLAHLRTSTVDPYRGGRAYTVAEIAAKWREGLEDDGNSLTARESDPPGQLRREAEDDLASAGLRIIADEDVTADADGTHVRAPQGWWLAVANSHQGTARLFEGTKWKRGTWTSPLRRLPGAARSKSSIRIGVARGGVASKFRVSLIPLEYLFDDPAPRRQTTITRGDEVPYP